MRLKTGIARGECASELPRGSRSSQAKSCASPMMREKAVRQTVSQHSSTMLMSRLHMISSPTGSASIRATARARSRPAGTTGSSEVVRATRMRRLPRGSTSSRSPGGTIVVDSRSSTMAGPIRAWPGARAYRSYTGVGTKPPDSGKYAGRSPFRAAAPDTTPS